MTRRSSDVTGEFLHPLVLSPCQRQRSGSRIEVDTCQGVVLCASITHSFPVLYDLYSYYIC